MKVDKLPLAEKAFDPARALQDGRKEPFLYLFSEAAKSLLARKVALDELPELAAASFHAYDFLTQWRFGLGSNEEIPLRDRFQALQKAASAMGDRNAAQVFADLLALDPYVLEGCLIESELCVKLNLPQLKEIDHENPVLTEVISLFGRSSDFPERLDGYLGENMPIELLSYEGWRKRIGEIVCQIDDYYVRPHRPHDILEVNFDLCETIGARVVGTGRIVFDWDMHKYSRVAVVQQGKALSSWATGVKHARNDFQMTGVSIRELFTTRGTLWTATYRDADDLIDPKTGEVMATVRSTKLRKDSLWLKDEAPDWQLLADRMWLKSKHPWVASKAWVRRLLGKH